MKKYFIPFIFAILLIQCARQSQPTGGPKDANPPELLSSIPFDGQKNYKGKEIVLLFDEYVKLKDPKEEIVITPSAGAKTKFIVKKTKVTIVPELPWKDSTTYSISFRGGIQDINESNPADNLRLAFSTGNIIDSLLVVGKVNETFKEKAPEKITIALYQADTFDIYKHEPTYISKTDKKGNFKIQNLKAGSYFLYAFEDKNKNFKVDGKSEKFGYLAKPITLPDQKDSVIVNLIQVDSRPLKLTSVRNTNTVSILRFNKPLDSAFINAEKNLTYTFSSNNSEVEIYKSFPTTDSLKLTFHGTDSVNQEIDTTLYIKYTDNKKIGEKFKQSDWQVSFDHETSKVTLQTSFNKLLSKVTLDSLYIQLDTTSYQQIKPEEILFDTLRKTLTLETKLNLEIKEKMLHPVLLLGRGAFISVDSDSSKTQDVKLDISSGKDTGLLTIEIQTNEKHFEIQLIDSKGKKIRSIRDTKKITWNYIAPAEYKILAIIDSNNNMKWDAGNYYKKLEPERVIIYINSDGKPTFPIRANWEVGPLVITF